MKVKTLIKILNKYNPEADIKINDYYGDVALFVNVRTNDDSIVWIEGERDIDLGSEISARYEYAADPNSGIKEVDFYMDLLEIGITIEMIREYMGIEYAEHMEKFCSEHGLI